MFSKVIKIYNYRFVSFNIRFKFTRDCDIFVVEMCVGYDKSCFGVTKKKTELFKFGTEVIQTS